ncbi:MAG: glycosyltransferase family 2 protein [Bacillota bacterium]|nr:glycosyltransferase family 2 protein [Bacillota bacterium]
MIEDKKVSIILCFYNEERYLQKAIDSVLAQTYHNFELIIINDGSTDGSDAIIKKYTDDRIIYKINTENRRLAYSRNRGLELATGDYIGFFDGDDIMLPDKMEKQVKYLKEHADVTLLSGGYKYMDAQGNVEEEFIAPRYVSDEQIRAYMLYGNCIACAGAALFRREILERQEIRFNEKNLASEDYRFWIDMMPYARFANVNECFFYYRVNHGSKAMDIVNQDRTAYDAEIRELLKHAWSARGFTLEESDFTFMHSYFYKRKKIWKPGTVYQGIKTYKKIKKQLCTLKLPEGKLILLYYKEKWLRAYRVYWIIKKAAGMAG